MKCVEKLTGILPSNCLWNGAVIIYCLSMNDEEDETWINPYSSSLQCNYKESKITALLNKVGFFFVVEEVWNKLSYTEYLAVLVPSDAALKALLKHCNKLSLLK